jgi:hypothetical protein
MGLGHIEPASPCLSLRATSNRPVTPRPSRGSRLEARLPPGTMEAAGSPKVFESFHRSRQKRSLGVWPPKPVFDCDPRPDRGSTAQRTSKIAGRALLTVIIMIDPPGITLWGCSDDAGSLLAASQQSTCSTGTVSTAPPISLSPAAASPAAASCPRTQIATLDPRS